MKPTKNRIKAVVDKLLAIDKYYAQQTSADTASFYSGLVWVCTGCEKIHVGFQVGTPVQVIAEVAQALRDLENVEFSQIPVYDRFDERTDESETFSGPNAYAAYAADLLREAIQPDTDECDCDEEDAEHVSPKGVA